MAGRILVLEVEIEDECFILINLYSPNTETGQLKVLDELQSLLSSFEIDQNKHIVLAGDFNFFLDSGLEA